MPALEFPKMTRQIIRDHMVDCLYGQTMAGANVTAARDWPTETSEIETGYIIVLPGSDRKELMMHGAPVYTTTAKMPILIRVARGGPETALAYIEALAFQVTALLLTYQPIVSITQFSPTVDTEIGLVSDSEIAGLAQASVTFTYQYPERFQAQGVPLQTITNTQPDGFGNFEVTNLQA